MIRLRFLLAAFALSALLILAGATPAAAAGSPDLQLSGGPAGSVVYGNKVPVDLTASIPAGQPKGYNLAFRAVLPQGTSYVSGSAGALDGEPRILDNAPSAGRTTLIWDNVDDLVPSSSHTLSFLVAYNDTGSIATPRYDVGDPIPIDTGAYISTEPRDETDFDGLGNPVGPGPGTWTGKAEQSTVTKLTAIQVAKSEPHPEGEIPRGLHDHQTVYTLKVTNNKVNPTNGASLEDYIPAGLEYLGCAGTADHTTDAPTNPGSTNEYKGSGSGPITVAHPTAAEDCVEPDLVETVELDPDGTGPLPAGVYTHIKWNSIGDFAPDGTRTLRYGAAIPIRENTLDWNGAAAGEGTAPADTGAQAANLDNNSGPETYDEQPLLNGATVAGTYQAPSKPGQAVSDQGTLLRTAEDIAIQKGRDIGSLEQGDITRWTLNLQTSEYRTVDDVVVHDELPNGLCPLGSQNYENASDQKAECDPVAGKNPSPDYTSVTENVDGTYDISWDASTVPALAHFEPSSSYQLVFHSRTRDHYQSNFTDSTPILSKDSVSNAVDVIGTDFIRLGSDGQKISHDEPDGVPDTDISAAGKAAAGPVLEKTVAAQLPASGDCNDLGAASYGKSVPVYGPGDQVCWKLRLVFPQKLNTTSQDVFDILPNTLDYVPGSAQTTANNTIPVGTVSEGDGRLSWEIGNADDVDQGGQVFEVTFKSTVGSPSGHSSGDVEGNLMKFSYENTAGQAFPLRDRTDFKLRVPPVSLVKGVRQINGTGTVFGPNSDNKTITGGDSVTYRIDVSNPGTDPLSGIRVWDRLPTGITCADVAASISDSGSCDVATNTLKWSSLTLAAGPGTSRTLTYTVDYPNGLSPDQNFVNTAGVVEYVYTANDGQPYQLIPANPLVKDPALPAANVAKAEDPSNVRTVASTVAKTRTTAITDTGNNAASQATIGERIDYTVTTTIPKDTTLYGTPTVVDALGARQTLVPGSLCATPCTLDGVALPTAGVSVAESPANTVTATLPATYTNDTGHDVKLVLNFSVRVNDVAANASGGTLPNTARLTYKDQQGRTINRTGSVNTSLVEPKLTIDKSSSPGSFVEGGDTITYTIKVKNTGVSPAYDVNVSDEPDAVLTNVANDPLPGGVTATKTWSAGDHTMGWHIDGPINPNQTVTLTYTAKVPHATALTAGEELDNTAEIDDYHGVPKAKFDEGGYRTYTGPSDSVRLTVAKPNLTIVKTPDNGNATAGEASSFTIKVTNTDPNAKATNVVVHDVLDAGLSYTPGSASAAPSAGFTETGAGGQTIDWKIAQLGPGGSVTITVPVTVGAGVAKDTLLVNTASTHADEVPDDKTDTGSLKVATKADLQVNKTSDYDPVIPGENVKYTIVTKNNGPSDALASKLTDTLPPYLTFVSLDDTGNCSVAGQAISCDYGTLAPGELRTLEVTAKLNPARTQPINNAVDVTTTTTDTNPANNHSEAPNTVKPTADVSITKTSDREQYDGGDTVTYTLTARNDGPSNAAQVTVDDDLPTDELDFVSVAPQPACSESGGHVHCDFGNLAPGEEAVATVTMKAKGNPPSEATGETHKITVSKQEQHLSLAAGETKAFELSCPGGVASDGTVQIVDVESGEGTPAQVRVLQARSIAPDTYRFEVRNETSGQAQVRPHLTCLPERTDDGSHPLEIGTLKTSSGNGLAPGRHQFTIPVADGRHAIAPGIEVLSGSARLVGNEPVAGGWRFTVEVLEEADVRVSLRTVLDTTGVGGDPEHVHEFGFEHVVKKFTIQPGRTNQLRVSCPTGYKGIVGTYDLPARVVPLGSVPEPINRDFDLWNGNDHPVEVTLDLECIAIETGGPLDELLPIVNTATVASATFDPDPGNDSDEATIYVARAAGSADPAPPPSSPPVSPSPPPPGSPPTPITPPVSPPPSTPKSSTVAPDGKLKVSSSGAAATLRLSCSGDSDCAGRAKLTAVVRSRKGRRKAVLGRSAYEVEAGATEKVKIKIAKRYRKKLRKGKVRRVKLVAGGTKSKVAVKVKKRGAGRG